MILFNKARIEFGEDYITPTRIDALLVLFETPDKGVIAAHLMQCIIETLVDAHGNEVTSFKKVGTIPTASVMFDAKVFTDVDLLSALHIYYMEQLALWNPSVVLENTLA